MKKRKTFVIICTFIVSCIALLLVHQFTPGNNAGSHFSWGSGNQKDSVVQVTTGKTVVVPFEFRVGNNVSEVRLAIRDESLRERGAFLEKTAVPVRNGMVSSKAIFKFQPGAGIKAGRYALTIIARDIATGITIREGEIPFDVDILDLIWKCSC
jgi:hypothetical protein